MRRPPPALGRSRPRCAQAPRWGERRLVPAPSRPEHAATPRRAPPARAGSARHRPSRRAPPMLVRALRKVDALGRRRGVASAGTRANPGACRASCFARSPPAALPDGSGDSGACSTIEAAPFSEDGRRSVPRIEPSMMIARKNAGSSGEPSWPERVPSDLGTRPCHVDSPQGRQAAGKLTMLCVLFVHEPAPIALIPHSWRRVTVAHGRASTSSAARSQPPSSAAAS